MDVQIIRDAYDWISANKDLVSNLIAAVAVVISIIALFKSGKAQKEQLRLERITAELAQQQIEQAKRTKNDTLALFLIELVGHLAELGRTLDHINPVWMHRSQQGIFNNKEISHSNLHVICYDSHVKDIENVDTRIRLDNYYKEVLVFNANGKNLQSSPIRNDVTVSHFVRGAARLIRTAIDLCERLRGMMDCDVLAGEQVRYSIEDLEQKHKWYITICNASYLDSSSLAQLCHTIKNELSDEEIKQKYPISGYILGLREAAVQLDEQI